MRKGCYSEELVKAMTSFAFWVRSEASSANAFHHKSTLCHRRRHLAEKVVLRTWRSLTLPRANRDATCRISVTEAPDAREISKVAWTLSS